MLLLLVLPQREVVWKWITFAVEIRKKKKKVSSYLKSHSEAGCKETENARPEPESQSHL